jgi:hypothetical protein
LRPARSTLEPGRSRRPKRDSGTATSAPGIIKDGACRNLLAEAGLDRYSDAPSERRAEIPIDEHNHAMAALRYLIQMIDAHRLAGRPAAPAPEPRKPERNCVLAQRELEVCLRGVSESGIRNLGHVVGTAGWPARAAWRCA